MSVFGKDTKVHSFTPGANDATKHNGFASGDLVVITEEKRKEYFEQLMHFVDYAYGEDAEQEMRNFRQVLAEIKQLYGEKVLREILKMRNSEKSFNSLMAMSCNGRRPEVEKLLVVYGAISTDKELMSPVQAAMILEGIAKEEGSTFNPILYSFSDADRLKNLREYFSRLGDEMISLGDKFDPVNRTIILAYPGHWSTCQFQCSVINGKPTMKMFFLDSTGLKEWGEQEKDIIKIASEIFDEKKLPKDNIQVYRSCTPLQRDGRSCRAFALTFARMFQSMVYGKFSKDFNLFDSLSKSLNGYETTTHTMDGVNVVDLVKYTPAKVQQTSQFVDVEKHPDQYAILKSQEDAKANSKGTSLGASLAANTVMDDGKGLNVKVDRKFAKMVDGTSRVFSVDVSEEERMAELERILDKFSTRELSGVVKQEIGIQQSYNKKLENIFDRLNQNKGNFDKCNFADDEIKYAVRMSAYIIRDEKSPGQCQFYYLSDEQRKLAAIKDAGGANFRTIDEVNAAVGYKPKSRLEF